MKKVVICGVDTSTLPKLSGKQSVELLKQIKLGNEDARQLFINANLRLVLSIVQRYNNRGVNMDDLFQSGCVGLIKSIENFDLKFGVKFSTYAVPMIAGEIRRVIRENNSLRISRGIRDTAYEALNIRQRLEESGVSATLEQVAEEMNVPIFNVVNSLNAISDTISIYEPVFSDEEDSFVLADQLSDCKQSEITWSDNVTLEEAIKNLDERERNILVKRYFQGMTQNEISNEIGLSQAQISRIEKDAIKLLKRNIEDL